MKKLMLATAITLPLLTGCVVAVGNGGEDVSVSSWQKSYKKNRQAIAELELNTSYQTTIDKLGTPLFNELLEKDGKEYRVIFYPTNSLHSDGKMTKDECTPIVFSDGKLSGFGETAYKKVSS